MHALPRIRIAEHLVGGLAILSVSAGAVMSAVRADAPATRASLSWQAPAAAYCATQAEIEQQVDRLAERTQPRRRAGHPFHVMAVAFPSRAGWVARVTLVDRAGQALGLREVSAPAHDCRALDIPVALVIATLLDGLQSDTDPSAGADESAPRKRSKRLGVRAFSALALRLGTRATPSLGLGVGLEGVLGIPIVVDASGYVPGEHAHGDGVRVRFATFHGGAALCPRVFGTRVETRLCAGTQAGAIWAKGDGLDARRSSLQPLVLLMIGPELLLELASGWSAQLWLAAAWLPVRPRFSWDVEGQGVQALEAGRFALAARLGIIDFLR